MKGHESIRRLIEDTVKALTDNADFIYAGENELAVQRNKKDFTVRLDPLRATFSYADNNVSNFSKAWPIAMAFYRFDKQAALPNESAKLLDEVDSFIDDFVNKLNFYSSQSEYITITAGSQDPFIKYGTEYWTGYTLIMTITVMDGFDYCEINC